MIYSFTHFEPTVETVKQLEIKLSTFAKRHHKAIQTDPAFRHKFLSMCAPLGVDPLTTKKSFWSFLKMGDFYHELAVKVAEVCYASRSRNGGIMSIKELQAILQGRGTKFQLNTLKANKYSEEDIIVAISKLSQLGSGFRTVKIGNSMMVISVPTELDNDHVSVFQLAQENKGQGLTVHDVVERTKWNEERVKRALDLLLSEGMAWLDICHGEEYYWFPSLWKESTSTTLSGTSVH
jgi:ESCRT-II complex subunit VPS22